MTKDFIPSKEAVFHNWQDNYMNVVAPNSVSWGVPPADLTALQGLQTAYVAAYQVGSKEQKLTRTVPVRQKRSRMRLMRTLQESGNSPDSGLLKIRQYRTLRKQMRV